MATINIAVNMAPTTQGQHGHEPTYHHTPLGAVATGDVVLTFNNAKITNLSQLKVALADIWVQAQAGIGGLTP